MPKRSFDEKMNYYLHKMEKLRNKQRRKRRRLNSLSSSDEEKIDNVQATTTIKPATSSNSTVTGTVTRRPFRIANRRRPFTTTVKTSTTTTTEATTVRLASEESLQDISDADYIEDPSLKPRTAPKTPKLQRRPLVTLKDEEIKDQNPSATNEEEKKRQSKKYSSTFKQNQLDEVLKRTKSQEESDTTTEGKTTVEDYNAETAVAIAAHQLLAAPIPITQSFDENTKPARKSVPTTTEFRYTKPDYTESYIDTKKPTYTDEYSSTPIYKTSTDYISSTGVYTGIATDFAKSYNPETTGFSKSATFNTDPSIFAKTTAFAPDSTVFGRSTAGYNSATTILSQSTPSYLPETSVFPKPTSKYSEPTGFTKSSYGPETSTYNGFTSRPNFPSTLLNRPSTLNPDVSVSPGGGSSTAKYLSTSDKYITLPVEDFGYSTSGYSSSSQDPSYFTREYLLESPVTKTYDDEYQYLSPVTKQQTTTRRSPQKKTVSRKISTTIKPTTPLYEVPVTTPKPRRVPSKKPFEKIPVQKSTFRPIENYDYYDDGVEKIAEKYAEGTKVVLHSKGTIECLDIGNFPHPTSCKKFISCARIENGSLLGWEYICPKGLSFDPVGGICNWSAGLGCDEKDIQN